MMKGRTADKNVWKIVNDSHWRGFKINIGEKCKIQENGGLKSTSIGLKVCF